MNKLKFILHQILRQKLTEDHRASLRGDMITLIKITKGHNSIKNVCEVMVLVFFASCLIMFSICMQFHEIIFGCLRVMEQTQVVMVRDRWTARCMDRQKDKYENKNSAEGSVTPGKDHMSMTCMF